MPIQTEEDARFIAEKIRDGTLTGERKERAFAELEAFKQPRNPALAFPVTRFALGTKLGLEQAKAGALQLGETIATGVRRPFTGEGPDTEFVEELQAGITERDERLKELGTAGQIGGMVGEALPSTFLPGGPSGKLLTRVAGGVASDVAASVADPVREDESRLGNLATAATFSAALRVPGASISSMFRRLAAARAGNVDKKDVRKLLEAADAEQIEVFFDDVSQGSFARQASAAAEIFGRFGTGSGRIRQNEQAKAAAERWLQRVSGDSDDYAEIVQSGLARKFDIFKREAARKYDRVARQIGDAGEVPTSTFDNAVDVSVAAEAAKGSRANAQVVDFLNRFKEAPRGNFDEMIEFRSDFNKELSDFIENESVSHSSIQALMRAKDALNKDMTEFAKANGALRVWQDANKFYQDTVLQFKKGKLRALLNDRSAANFDDQAAWKYLVAQSANNPKRARLMWQSLDSKGREAVRAGLISEAFEKAAADGAPFSPAKFAGYLEARGPVVDQFFKGRSGREIKGLIKVMRQIQQAGSIAINPPTGARAIPAGIAALTVVEPASGAAMLGGAAGLKGLFQTPTGRNLLLGASKATPGSKAFDEIMEKILKITSRASN